MGIVKRVSRLLQADMNGLLDVLEDPREMLKQSMREMEEELAKQEAEQRTLREREQTLRKQYAEGEQQLAAVISEVKLCLEAQNEALARAAVRRKLEVERSLTRLTAARESLSQQRESHAVRVQEARSRYEVLRDKVALFPEQSVPSAFTPKNPEQPISDSDVEIALLRERAAFANEANQQKEVAI